MEYTKLQRKALRHLEMSKLIFRKMWKYEKQIGYCTRGRRSYDINIASDTGNKDVEKSALAHEIGHVYYNHMDVDFYKELKDVKALAISQNREFSRIMRFFGGPMAFLNIAMDLEINTKLLTPDNINVIEDNLGVALVHRDKYDIEDNVSYDTFRDYYIPLFDFADKYKDQQEEFENMLSDALKDLISSGKDVMKSGAKTKGNGGEESDDDEDSDEDGNNNKGKEEEGKGKGKSLQDKEIDDLLEEEDYKGGDDKSNSRNIDEATTVGDYEEKNGGSDEEVILVDCNRKNIGHSSKANNEITIAEGDPDEEMKKFLIDIVSEEKDLHYIIDPIKHYNRGSRHNSDNLLYSSTRRKRSEYRKKSKLGICIDISGSMNIKDIVKAARSLDEVSNVINNKSILITCNERVNEEHPILNIPENLDTGGGTDMSKGLSHLIEKGLTDIVIYSDFYTEMDKMIKALNEAPKGVNVYSILVGAGELEERNKQDKNFKEYMERNKKILILN